jgi:peroxiredoxin
MATPQQAAAFRQQYELPFPVLADPQREAYQAFRLARGTLGQVAGPRMWLAGLKATLRGGVGRPSGDVWQMPGAFVIDREGIVRFAHYPSHTGDLPSHEAMLRAIQLAVDKAHATDRQT